MLVEDAEDGGANRASDPLTDSSVRWSCLILLVSALFCLAWSYYKLFWVDELLEFYTDTKPSVTAIVHGQLHTPFSLEPPAYHVLLHAFHSVIHLPELASRLPSIVALLITELCVFFITLRFTGEQQTALIGMVLPFAMITADYGPEARVYGLLTACFAVALLCWQSAASRSGGRGMAVCGLALSLACAIDLHYYGILLVLPLCAAESVRWIQRGRADWPVVAALVAGTGCFMLNLPFQRALVPFQLHYYDAGETHWKMIVVTYNWFFMRWRVYNVMGWQKWAQMLGFLPLMILVGLIGKGPAQRVVREWRLKAVWQETALVATMLLPVLNVVVAHFTRAYWPRYSLPAVPGVAVLLAAFIGSFSLLKGHRQMLLSGLLLLGCLSAGNKIRQARREKADRLSSLQMNERLKALTEDQQDHSIYVQETAHFLVDHQYASPSLAGRIVGFNSGACELHWLGHDPASRFVENMAATTKLPIVPFAALYGVQDSHLLVLYHDPSEEWVERELKQDGALVTPLGKALGGDLIRVAFRSEQTCDREALH